MYVPHDIRYVVANICVVLSQSSVGAGARFPYAGAERVRHNHTYSAPLAAPDQRPAATRDKRGKRDPIHT